MDSWKCIFSRFKSVLTDIARNDKGISMFSISMWLWITSPVCRQWIIIVGIPPESPATCYCFTSSQFNQSQIEMDLFHFIWLDLSEPIKLVLFVLKNPSLSAFKPSEKVWLFDPLLIYGQSKTSYHWLEHINFLFFLF